MLIHLDALCIESCAVAQRSPSTVSEAPRACLTVENEYPETPVTSEKLPIINTHHGSDHIKANVLNPRPVCNPFEDYRTVVY